MIRFCDKEVFTVTLNEVNNMSKSQLINFFLENNSEYIESVIMVVDEEGKFYGCISYNTLLFDSDYIIRDYFIPSETFWDEANLYFSKNPKREVIVINEDKAPLGFCYLDDRYYYCEPRLEVLESVDNIQVSLLDLYKGVKLICINDLNELAWRSYKLLKRCGYQVCLLGEEWEWFGIKTMEGFNEYPSYEKMYIYAEGNSFQRKMQHVDSSFYFFVEWNEKNVEVAYKKAINALIQQGINVCKVIVPRLNDIDKNMCSKEDLINILYGLSNSIKLSSNKEERELQRRFFGDKAYLALERGEELQKDAWQTVIYNNLKGEKLRNVAEKKRIYLIGPCIVNSAYALAENSITAELQKLVRNQMYEVIKVFCPIHNFNLLIDISNLPIKSKDIVIFINHETNLGRENNCEVVFLKELYNRPRNEVWLKDGEPLHVNGRANRAIANYIYDNYLKKKIDDMEIGRGTYIQRGEVLSATLQQVVFDYVDIVRNDGFRNKILQDKEVCKIGSIVMNCNPFTKGHQYLIEKAASEVDLLYIFVVQEDKSYFPFEERYNLVKAGTEHLGNVIVVPSGEYVLSYKTLPGYFEKEKNQTAQIDASQDIEIFARYIAPKLGINYRFVGEEPIDNITRQYNEQMSEILPEFGIEFVEIPRKLTETDNEVISASRVRRLMKENKWEEIKELVPDKTYEYLRNNFR